MWTHSKAAQILTLLQHYVWVVNNNNNKKKVKKHVIFCAPWAFFLFAAVSEEGQSLFFYTSIVLELTMLVS